MLWDATELSLCKQMPVLGNASHWVIWRTWALLGTRSFPGEMFSSEHHQPRLLPAQEHEELAGCGRDTRILFFFSLAVAPEHLAGLAGAWLRAAGRDSLHLAQGLGLLAAFKALGLSDTDSMRSLMCVGNTKAKLSHNSTEGLVEPPEKQSQAAASSCSLCTLAKEKVKMPQKP